MSKNKIKISLLVIFTFMFILLIFPNYSNAETFNIEYKNINETSTLKAGNFYFSPI